MNIYNTLYFVEYSRSPVFRDSNSFVSKSWFLNLSVTKYHREHRIFDLPSMILHDLEDDEICKEWRRYGQECRNPICGCWVVNPHYYHN